MKKTQPVAAWWSELVTKPGFIFGLGCLVLGVFFGLRLYGITTSLSFHGDVGRDLVVLQTWRHSFKPPLLGPQTSVFSFNHTAWYYYLLFPLYLLTLESEYSPILSVLLFYSVAFIAALFYWRRQPAQQLTFLLFFWFLAIHPQFVEQHRYVWNPSFIAPFLLTALICLHKLAPNSGWPSILLFSSAVALAVSFTFSAIPVILVLFLLSAWQLKNQAWKVVLGLVLAGVVVNSSTLFFELRHNFVLLRHLFSHGVLQQSGQSWARLQLFVLQSWPALNSIQSYLMAGVLLVTAVGSQWWNYYKSPLSTFSLLAGRVLLLTVVITVVVPIQLHTHYLLTIIVLAAAMVAWLPAKISLPITAALSVIWLNPIMVARYWQPATPPLATLSECAQAVCEQLKGAATYVSVVSPSHNHSGWEYRFLLKKAGCPAPLIDDEPGKAQTMVVFAHDGSYEHNKTAYNELTLFGPAREINSLSCAPNLRVHVLKK